MRRRFQPTGTPSTSRCAGRWACLTARNWFEQRRRADQEPGFTLDARALEAAERLEKEDGLQVEVLDLRTLLPMDDEAIMASVRKTNHVLIAHEDTRTGGVAGEITARINDQAFEWLDAPVRRVTAHDVPLPYAPTLEDFVLPQTDDLVVAARWLAAY